MNISSSFSNRLAASSLLALAAMISVPQAQAFKNDQILSGEQTPDWSVFLGPNCSGIQITPHVTLTSRQCASDAGAELFYPKINMTAKKVGQRVYENPVAFFGLVMTDASFTAFDSGLQTANILSYLQEKEALVDGNDALTTGAKLVLFSATPGANYSDRYVTSTGSYFNNYNPTADARPLIYRSLYRYYQLEPGRFKINSPSQILPSELLQQIVPAFLVTAGLESDLAAGISSPIVSSDVGGGVFYLGANGKTSLLAAIGENNTHRRLSELWPTIFYTLRTSGWRNEAITLSQKVLGTSAWGTNNRVGREGDIYVYDNPFTGDIEFFRLIGTDADQRYGWFPIAKDNNNYWQYLGTALPEFDVVTTPVHAWGREKVSRVGNINDIYVYYNPYSRKVEYFRLLTSAPYGYFPIDQVSNSQWKFLGTELTTKNIRIPPPLSDE